METPNADCKKHRHRWIRDDVEIDFPLPREIKYLIEDLERLDEAEDYGYCNYSETLDYTVRDCWLDKKITKKQGELICWKYTSMF